MPPREPTCAICTMPIQPRHPVRLHEDRPAHIHCRLQALGRTLAAEQERWGDIRTKAAAAVTQSQRVHETVQRWRASWGDRPTRE